MMDWLGFGPSDHRAPLTGRVGAMYALDKALEQVLTRGEPRVVTVLGASGVGKTRLVQEFLAKVRRTRGSDMRTYRGSARDARDSFGLFARILRARFGLVEGLDADVTRERVRTQVAEVLDDRKVGDVIYFLGQLMDVGFEESPLTKAVADNPMEARLLRRSVFRSFLAADAARGPLCLVFEDLHDAHDESLALLQFLLEHLEGPVLAIGVGRNELETRRDGWRTIREPSHAVVDLSPLGELDAASMMHALLAPCGEPPQQLVDAACQLAGGNPLLLEQMVRIFHDTGVLEEDDALGETPLWRVHLEKLETVRLPLTIDDAVQARVSALAPAERRLLERAAAVGSVFWLGALVVLERLERPAPELWSAADDTDERYIRDQLREMVERDYVLRLPDSTFPGDEEYIFKHNLERERVAKLTSPSASRRYHRTIADWLEHQSDVRSHEEYVGMLASHREAAGNLRSAAVAYLDAGDVARARYSSAKAMDHYRKGLSLLGEDEPGRRMAALHHLGDVCQQLGRNEEALQSFREMLALAFRLGMRGKGGAAHNRIGRLFRETGVLDQAARHLTTGLALFEAQGDRRGIASSLDDIGKLHWLRGDYPHALEEMRAALNMRRRIGDRRSIALSLNNMGLVLQDSGQFQEALEAFEQALQIRREIGDLIGVSITLNNLGTVAQDQGDFAKALSMFEEASKVAREIGDKNKIALVLTNLGEVHRVMGNAAEAVNHLRQAVELCEDLNDRLGLAEALRPLGMAYMQKNEISKARECISRAVDIFAAARSRVHLGQALRTLGEITAGGGWGPEHAGRARDYLRQSIAIFEEIGNELELARTLQSYADFLEREELPDAPADGEARVMRHRAETIFTRLRTASSSPGTSDAR
ncbi:MAG: tetratricopeptide repeat protein [Polyangiaceae bacterium]|nr:tetratricopeptide repeat protein [Polyangiaceae bacterium]